MKTQATESRLLSSVEELPFEFNEARLVKHRLRQDPTSPGFLEFSTAPGLGDATTSLITRLPDGREVSVFPSRDLLEATKMMEKDPNLPFKLWNTPLFPLANRLRGGIASGEVQSLVEGLSVKMPRNHRGGNPESESVHLHGLLYRQRATESRVVERGDQLIRESRFGKFMGGWWRGEADVTIRQSLTPEEFRYEIMATNTGDTSLPVGFGSHPYFHAPSEEPSAIQIRVPARRVATITSVQDVFPTGELRLTSEAPELNFNSSRSIEGTYLDHYWTELIPDEEGFPFAEMIDSRAGTRYRITATTPNILGVQVFYPASGPIVAIELVTHLPDPRREIWKHRPTGMRILEPGESERYGYKIEVFPTATSHQ